MGDFGEYCPPHVESLLFGAGLWCLTGAQCTSLVAAVVHVARLDDGVHSSAVVAIMRHTTNSSPDSPVAVRVVYFGAFEMPPLFACAGKVVFADGPCRKQPLRYASVFTVEGVPQQRQTVVVCKCKITGIIFWAHTRRVGFGWSCNCNHRPVDPGLCKNKTFFKFTYMHLIRGKCGSLSFIFTHPPVDIL